MGIPINTTYTQKQLNQILNFVMEYVHRITSYGTQRIDAILGKEVPSIIYNFQLKNSTVKLVSYTNVTEPPLYEEYVLDRPSAIDLPVDLPSPSLSSNERVYMDQILLSLDNLRRRIHNDIGFYHLCSWSAFNAIIVLQRIEYFIKQVKLDNDPYLDFISEYIKKEHFNTSGLLTDSDFNHDLLWSFTSISGSDDQQWVVLSLLENLRLYPDQSA